MSKPQRPQVNKYMSPAPQTVGRDISLESAKDIMASLAIRHLPVVQGEKVVGIVSDRDIQILETLGKAEKKSLLVDDAMTREVFLVTPETPLKDAVGAMHKGKFGSAVVVKEGKVCGIFTTIDALRALDEFLS